MKGLRKSATAITVAAACLCAVAACSSSGGTKASPPATGGAGGTNSTASTGTSGTSGPQLNQSIRAKFPKAVLDRGTLRIGDTLSPPNFILNDDKMSGIDYDLFNDVAQLAGLKAKFTVLPFASMITALQADKVDVTGTLLPSADRLAVANFAVFFKVPYGILLPKGNPKNVHDAGDLCGGTVALVQGSTPPQALVEDRQAQCKSEGKPAIKTHLYADQSSAVLAVKSGAADAFIQSQALTAYIAKTTDGGQDFTSVSDLKGLDGTVYFADAYGVLKANSQLLTAVQAALQELVNDGTYQKVLAKYGVEDDAVKTISINKLTAADLGK